MRQKRRIYGVFCAAALILTSVVNVLPVHAAGETGRTYIVKYRESAACLMADDSLPFALVSEAEKKRLERLDLLEWYEPDGEGVLLDDTAAADDITADGTAAYYEPLQWNLDVIQAGGAFARDCLGQGVRVGVVDSGVSVHADLEGRVSAGHNYMEGAADPEDTADNYGHGTKVAGLIAGAGEHGYIGAAPAAEIVPLKITDGKTVKVSAICRAIYGGVDEYHCGVLNLSLGVTGQYRSLREAVAYAEAQNVVLTAAVGNSGKTTAYYPASYDSVMGVGAVDRDGSLSAGSNHNKSVFLTAPGIDVRSTAASGGYALSTGTSFAVPQVTGAAAVLRGMDSSLSPAEIRALLAQSAADRGAAGYDEYYGYGIVNLAGSVSALLEKAPVPPCAFLPDSGPATRIQNHTAAPLRVTYLLAEYGEDGRYRGVTAYPLSIPACDTAEITPPAPNARYGQFVCAPESMIPLIAARKNF